MKYVAKSNISHNGESFSAGDEVVLTDEEAKALSEAGVVDVQDEDGNPLTHDEAFPLNPEEAVGRERVSESAEEQPVDEAPVVPDEPQAPEAPVEPAAEATGTDVPLVPMDESESQTQETQTQDSSPESSEQGEQVPVTVNPSEPTSDQIAQDLESMEEGSSEPSNDVQIN